MVIKRKANPPADQARFEERWDIFLSHSSTDDGLATRLEQTFQATGIRVWVDHSDLRRSGLLLSALQDALLRCAHLVLLWSQAAEQSRYVTAEWNFAWNREIAVIPCRLDQTLLPLGLAGYLYCDFRANYDTGFTQLREAIRTDGRPHAFSALRTFKPMATQAYQQSANDIFRGQDALLTALQKGKLDTAAHLQAELDPKVAAAVQAYPQDAWMLSTAGYQKKNAYQIKYWPQIQARQSPQDPLLAEAEQYFWAALQVQPNYAGALNGLGSILWLRGDLDAAEFYVQRSLERAEAEGISYGDAETDLKNIRQEKRLQQKRET